MSCGHSSPRLAGDQRPPSRRVSRVGAGGSGRSGTGGETARGFPEPHPGDKTPHRALPRQHRDAPCAVPPPTPRARCSPPGRPRCVVGDNAMSGGSPWSIAPAACRRVSPPPGAGQGRGDSGRRSTPVFQGYPGVSRGRGQAAPRGPGGEGRKRGEQETGGSREDPGGGGPSRCPRGCGGSRCVAPRAPRAAAARPLPAAAVARSLILTFNLHATALFPPPFTAPLTDWLLPPPLRNRPRPFTALPSPPPSQPNLAAGPSPASPAGLPTLTPSPPPRAPYGASDHWRVALPIMAVGRGQPYPRPAGAG